MSNWNASNYRNRKAKRLAAVKPQWAVNSETGEEFYLRPVSSLASSVLAGFMPSGLTQVAIEAWKKKGLDGLNNIEDIAATLTPEQIDLGAREVETLSHLVQQACVIPLLSSVPAEMMEFSDEWKAAAMAGLKEKDPKFNESKFDPQALVLDPRELDELDAQWLFRWARGRVAIVALKGGEAMNVSDLERFRKRPGRRSRARVSQQDLRETA